MRKLLFAFTLLMGFTAFSQGLTLGKEPSKEIKLERGTLRAIVGKQKQADFVIRTSVSVASVKGTDFWIASTYPFYSNDSFLIAVSSSKPTRAYMSIPGFNIYDSLELGYNEIKYFVFHSKDLEPNLLVNFLESMAIKRPLLRKGEKWGGRLVVLMGI